MREVVSNVCADLMSPYLPLLIPTANNLSKVEPNTDCFKLNTQAKEAFLLRKYHFLGYFIGWSMRCMGGLGIDIAPAFWKRVCEGPDYIYTLEDLRSMDVFRYDMLTKFKKEGPEVMIAELKTVLIVNNHLGRLTLKPLQRR